MFLLFHIIFLIKENIHCFTFLVLLFIILIELNQSSFFSLVFSIIFTPLLLLHCLIFLDGIILNKFGFTRKMPYFASILAPLICKLYNLPSETIINTTQAILVHYGEGNR